MIRELYTKRLHLRKMIMTDAPKLFQIWSDPQVTEFMNITSFTNENQAIEMINLLDKLARDKKAIRYSIIQLETNELIGSCGFNVLDYENSKTEIGYDIGKPYWGNGYAPEAISALIKIAFYTLNLNRVEAKVEPANINSIKVLQKLKFTFEGTLRQAEKSKGKFIDLHIYSKLKSD
ncbi:GNAT family N-acetyltransferase [Bacillus sp. Marseille-P3661]|uniref:GNAT family N-acetyltransferase n=1 Tax=Bacillus sp. Marseille-P3661 TaxID=1936234 RepID=UPI000C834BDF|nr:GNAT family protein [Bacillus sp. Marseille-P3661]